MSYRVALSPRSQRQLKTLPPDVRSLLLERLVALGREPRPPGVRKLENEDNVWRIRVGQYRIVFQIDDRIERLLVLKVERRNEATYRGLH